MLRQYPTSSSSSAVRTVGGPGRFGTAPLITASRKVCGARQYSRANRRILHCFSELAFWTFQKVQSPPKRKHPQAAPRPTRSTFVATGRRIPQNGRRSEERRVGKASRSGSEQENPKEH